MLKGEGKDIGANPESADLPVRVILTGFRATGKSVVGERLAALIGYRFLDTDKELVSRTRCSVAEFVRKQGWPAFRELEKELLARLASMTHVVIATGGGAVLHQQQWQTLRDHSLVVWLQADAHTISTRLRVDPVSDKQRPSLTGHGTHEEVEVILAERETSYREGSDVAIDTTDRTPEEIATLIRDHIETSGKQERTQHGR